MTDPQQLISAVLARVQEFVAGLSREQIEDLNAGRLELTISGVDPSGVDLERPAGCTCPCAHLGGVPVVRVHMRPDRRGRRRLPVLRRQRRRPLGASMTRAARLLPAPARLPESCPST